MFIKRNQFDTVCDSMLVLAILAGIAFVVRYFHLFYFPLKTVHYVFLYGGLLGFITLVLVLVYARDYLFKKRAEVILLLCVFVLGIALIEAALFVTDTKTPRFIRHHYLNYMLNPEYVGPEGNAEHNSLGFRGPEIEQPKPSDTFRIVTFGGSSTYTSRVPHWRYDFQRVLQGELRTYYDYENIEVINGGVSGYSSWESMLNFILRGVELEPDLIIVYHGINDASARSVPPDVYRADNSGARKQWGKDPLCLHLYCSRIFSKLTNIYSNSLDIYPDTYQPSADNRYNPVLGMRVSEVLEKNQPRFFERNLRNMIAVAREHGIEVVLVTWAYSPKQEMATAHMQKAVAEQNEIVRALGETHDVHVYDFAAEMSTSTKYWDDGAHVTIEGAQLKGELFASYLIGQNVIGDRVTLLKDAGKAQ